MFVLGVVKEGFTGAQSTIVMFAVSALVAVCGILVATRLWLIWKGYQLLASQKLMALPAPPIQATDETNDDLV